MHPGPESVTTDEVSAFIERWHPGGGSERSNYQLFLTSSSFHHADNYLMNENAEIVSNKRKIFLMLYSARAFNLAKEACDYIIEYSLQKGDRIFYSLFSSVAVNYSRPFKRSRMIGALPNKMVPEEFRVTHESLIKSRDTIFAHADGGADSGGWGSLNQVRYIKEGSKIRPIATEVVGSMDGLIDTSELCKILQKKCLYHTRRLHSKHRKLFPDRDGEYLLTIDNDSEEFVALTETLDGPNESISEDS